MSVGTEAEPFTIRYLDTRSAYDAWSEVYDTDGNFLQALDTMEMKKLLPTMLSLIKSDKPWQIVDLGCGTGRNTMALLHVPDIEITAIDLSPRMLQIAKDRLLKEMQNVPRPPKLGFEVYDMIGSPDVPQMTRDADAIVSTLVVEHVPLDIFFRTAAKILKSGGLFLVTNMHSEMGKISQAGFIDPKTGEKIRPTSYAHTVLETIEEAQKHGFEVVGSIDEKSVDADLAPKLGARAQKWIGVTVWFGGIFRKLK